MQSKLYSKYFDTPVIWKDEMEGEISKASLDGFWFGGSDLEGCVFHFELKKDKRSVKVSISDSVSSQLEEIYSNFEEWAPKSLETFIQRETVQILNAKNLLPLNQVDSTPTKKKKLSP